MSEGEIDAWESYETGPFCRHFATPPGDCEEVCGCGHCCARHTGDGGCDDCECPGWRERQGDTNGEDMITTDNWKAETTDLAILFHAAEGDKPLALIPRDAAESLVEDRVMLLWDKGFLAPKGSVFQPTDKGRAALAAAARLLDELSKLRVFGSVDVTRSLLPDEQSPDNPDLVYANMYDPRFGAYGQRGERLFDLRLAMLQGIGEALSGYQHEGQTLGAFKVDPHRVVFLQLLGDGTFSGANIWAQLMSGQLHAQVAAIVEAAYRWQDLAPEDPGRAAAALLKLYAAGLVEERKRQGTVCSACRRPLGIYEAEGLAAGRALENCPSCGASFTPPAAAFSCGRCDAPVQESQERCGGCGVLVDFAAPSGQVSRVTTKTSRTTWQTTYVYEPYGYLDPFCPWRDYSVFSLFGISLVLL